MIGRNTDYYDAHARTDNIEGVTSSDDNAIILQKLRDNCPEMTLLSIDQEFSDDPTIEFIVREGDDLGWLGYFLGCSTTLTELHINDLPQDKWRILAFIRELVSNRSIQKLVIGADLGDGFHSLGTLLRSDSLVTLDFHGGWGFNDFDTIGVECARKIASMLDQKKQRNHLQSLTFDEFDISGEAMVEITTALSAHPQLEKLDLNWNTPPGDSVALGCVLVGWKNPELKELCLWQEVFDDEGLHALVAGMRNCRNLISLSLTGNSITANGCRILSTLFHSDHFCLEQMNLDLDIGGYPALPSVTRLMGLRSRSLKSLSIRGSSIGNDLSTLMPAVGSLRLLETLNLACNMIDNEGARALAGQLAHLPLLKEVNLSHTSIGNEEASALAAGLMHLRSVKKLDLSENQIGDEGISALGPALASLESLESLDLSCNRSITTLGVVSLSAFLRSDSCSLVCLSLLWNNMGDDGAVALADGLKGKKLRELHFCSGRFTTIGWSAFSKLLCDTSSVNNTYLSNHTLKTGFCDNIGAPEDVKQLLSLNKHPDEHVAIHKILKSHVDFDVEPFFEWDLKALPLLVSWFEKVITLVHVDDHKWISDESLEGIQCRKLSTMYKFVRGLPDLATDGYRHNNAAMSAILKRKINQLMQDFTQLWNDYMALPRLRLRENIVHTNRNA